MRIVWLTDIHLNFLDTPGDARAFGAEVAAEHEDAEVALVTGDIAEAPNVATLLTTFAEGMGKPVYFVLGNHDYYHGSFAEVEGRVASWATGSLHWLTSMDPIEIAPGVALCGAEGWYDGQAADPAKSNVRLHDFRYIKDFAGLHPLVAFERMHAKAKEQAGIAEGKLRKVAGTHAKVVFATHIPPFPGATWHLGHLSDRHWLPWMCNLTMGRMLLTLAEEFPSTEFLVLCGHTHSAGAYQPLPNLRVLSGRSEYTRPCVTGVLELPWESLPWAVF